MINSRCYYRVGGWSKPVIIRTHVDRKEIMNPVIALQWRERSHDSHVIPHDIDAAR